jgi:chemotaxis protein CheX
MYDSGRTPLVRSRPNETGRSIQGYLIFPGVGSNDDSVQIGHCLGLFMMSIDVETLQQVVNDVCSGMLGLNLEPSESAVCDESDALSAVVRISGGWESLVQVLAPRSTARTIASTMFAMEETNLTEAEIHDAVGEIVNMVGGNLKGIVEGTRECESMLSIPCVGAADAGSPFGTLFDGVGVGHQCEGNPLIVRILDRARPLV